LAWLMRVTWRPCTTLLIVTFIEHFCALNVFKLSGTLSEY
jgi:hypothetical protein